ncbi:MAG: hypothetical protein EXR77_19120 [Myxococcales bacterium]|nr:hypothetical protein [Myxococcales bacterium]
MVKRWLSSSTRLSVMLMVPVSLVVSGCVSAVQVAQTTVPRTASAQVETLLPSEAEAFASAGLDPAQLRCLARQRWSTTLRSDAKFTASQVLDEIGRHGVQIPDDKRELVRRQLIDTLFWRMVLTQIIDDDLHNFGATRLGNLTDGAGKPLLLLRTAFTARPAATDSCVYSLVATAKVRHIVNLYSGPMPTGDLEASERQVIQAAGGSYYSARDDPHGNWREDLRQGEGGQARQTAMAAVAEVIKTQILRPNGAAPKGSVVIHCGGGMHRTGMIFGVFERCINKTPWPEVQAGYQRHVGYRSPSERGGFEEQNLKFIEEFDCSLVPSP